MACAAVSPARWVWAAVVAVAVCESAASAEDVAQLLIGEYNNNEQVWQRTVDGEAASARRHWRIARLDDGLLGVAVAPGQDAPDWPAWRLRVDRERMVVVGADGDDTACGYRWREADAGFLIARDADAGCPASLPPTLRITPDELVLTDGHGGTVQARRVARYTGWVALQRRRIDPAAAEDDYILLRDQSLHDEGFVVSIADGDEPTGYAIELARLTYRNTRTAVLKLGVIDEASGETVGYSWAEPDAARIGINLRWIQAGMTRAEATAPAPLRRPR